MTAPPKLLSTNFARKGFFSNVNVLVADQVAPAAKFLSADLTPVKSYYDNW